MMNWWAGRLGARVGSRRLRSGAVAGHRVVRHHEKLHAIPGRRPGQDQVLPEVPVGIELPVELQQVAALTKIEIELRTAEAVRCQWVSEHGSGPQAPGSFHGQGTGYLLCQQPKTDLGCTSPIAIAMGHCNGPTTGPAFAPLDAQHSRRTAVDCRGQRLSGRPVRPGRLSDRMAGPLPGGHAVRPAAVDHRPGSGHPPGLFPHRIGVVPQGGNTGLVGGAIPHSTAGATPDPGLCPAPQRHSRPWTPDNFTITAEAGCVLAAVQAAAAAAGRLFPLSLAAEGSCQLGGNISTNAGGTAVLRLREHARPRPGPRGGPRGRPGARWSPEPAQGQHRLRPQAAVHRRRGHAGLHHRGNLQAVSAAQADRDGLGGRADRRARPSVCMRPPGTSSATT